MLILFVNKYKKPPPPNSCNSSYIKKKSVLPLLQAKQTFLAIYNAFIKQNKKNVFHAVNVFGRLQEALKEDIKRSMPTDVKQDLSLVY